jgi:VWFA-related protein
VSALALAQDQPQQPNFTINISTQLVVQTVSVTDKDGKPIEGLTAEDFLLTEDNVSQTISVFEFEKLDGTALPQQSPTLAADRGPVQPPQQIRIVPVPPGESRYQDRRLLALFFDMPALGDAERYRALASAQEFIQKQMTASDLIAIMTYSDGAVRIRRDFTDDRDALYSTIFSLMNGEDQTTRTRILVRIQASSTSSPPIVSLPLYRPPSTCSALSKKRSRSSTSQAAST